MRILMILSCAVVLAGCDTTPETYTYTGAPTGEAAVEAMCNDQASGYAIGAATGGGSIMGAMIQSNHAVEACMAAHGYTAQ